MGHMGQAGIKTCCLYICLIFLSSVILLTSFTIQWILYSIQFSLEGVGVVSLVEGGLKISGQTHIMDSMYASRISSVRRVPLRLVSDGNFSVNINNKNKNIHTDLLLEKAGFRVTADQMVVTDSNKKTLFSSSGRETVIGSDRVILSAQAGVSVKESLATKAVRSPAGHSLSLESTTSSLALLAPAGVDITSQSGHVNIQAYRDVMFRARGHNSQFRIDAGTILLPGLPTLARQPRRAGHSNNQTVYQLCICRSGRLFLAPALTHCIADSHVCRDTL